MINLLLIDNCFDYVNRIVDIIVRTEQFTVPRVYVDFQSQIYIYINAMIISILQISKAIHTNMQSKQTNR